MKKTDEAVATVADKLGDKALQYLQSFEDLAKQYSPDVVDAGLNIVRVYGAQELILGILCIALLLYIFFKAKAAVIKDLNKGGYSSGGNVLPIIIGASLLGIFPVAQATAVFSIWNWVAVFEPKLYLAYKIFGKLF